MLLGGIFHFLLSPCNLSTGNSSHSATVMFSVQTNSNLQLNGIHWQNSIDLLLIRTLFQKDSIGIPKVSCKNYLQRLTDRK